MATFAIDLGGIAKNVLQTSPLDWDFLVLPNTNCSIRIFSPTQLVDIFIFTKLFHTPLIKTSYSIGMGSYHINFTDFKSFQQF